MGAVVADEKIRKTSAPIIPRVESQKILTSDEYGSKIENMMVTEEGTLRSVVGPVPYVPNYGSGYPLYSTAHGIFHCLLQDSERDVLLLHTGNQLWVHQGWNVDYSNPSSSWEVLLGPSSSNPYRNVSLPDPSTSGFPTQFESTPTGVVIAPQGARAYFYDGREILPLGYSQAPATPTGHGPASSFGMDMFATLGISGSEDDTEGYYSAVHSLFPGSMSSSGQIWNDWRANVGGYAHDGAPNWTGYFGTQTPPTGMHPDFGFGAIGTLDVHTGVHSATPTATLLSGRWQAKTQWIDLWGNVSPLSASSNDVMFQQERGDIRDVYGVNKATDQNVWNNFHGGFKADRLLKQILWTSVTPGPEGTIGRIVSRTRDLINSGSLDYYEMTSDQSGSYSAFATLPDNSSTVFPDNNPDSKLNTQPVDPIAVPQFKLCRQAFGRLWIANTDDNPGVLLPSMPGRWGTFEKGMEIKPDASGSEITGLWRGYGVLLVFTASSVFEVKPSDTVAKGTRPGFSVNTLSGVVGCVAPSSLGTMSDGSVVWLGYDQFYRLTKTKKEGFQIQPISADIERTLRNLNKSRIASANAIVDPKTGEYRCWVSDQATKLNGLCLIYDGSGWRRRTDVESRASCVTKDHRQYNLIAGTAYGVTAGERRTDSLTNRNGVWLLDHSVQSFTPDERTSAIETTWLTGLKSLKRKTGFTVYIWLREMRNTNLNVEVYRDWRMDKVHTETVNLHSTEDPPPFWGTSVLGTKENSGDGDSYKLRRPFWVKADLFLPACESFKLRFESTEDYEFVAIAISEGGVEDGGMRIPK